LIIVIEMGILEEIQNSEKKLKDICEELLKEADRLDREAEMTDSIEMIELLSKAEGIRMAIKKIMS